MGLRDKRDHKLYPTADHELTDAEIIEKYGPLLAFHVRWVESGIDLDGLIEMATNANKFGPEHRQD